MAIIANAEVKTCVEAWSGEVSTGRHQFITDKPASFGGQDKGPAPYDFICIVKLLYYSYKIRKKLEITHRLSRSTILYAYV